MKTKNIFLISALCLSGLYFVFLMLSIFGVFNIKTPNSFNFIWAIVGIIVCLGLYTLALFIENRKKLDVPVWISCTFITCFFIFVNIFYILGFYENIYLTMIFYAALSVLVSILSISIYYNCLKNDDGLLRNKLGFTGFMLFSISTTLSVCFEVVIVFIKYLSNTNINLTTYIVSSFSILLLGAGIFALLFSHSIKGNKKFANACLIKVSKTASK